MKKFTRIIAAALLAALTVSILLTGTAFADSADSYYPGKIVTFGTYEQDNNLSNGTEPLEWIALERDGNEILMITRYAVDCRPFHEYTAKVGWEDSSLRDWMNNVFYSSAFSASEKQRIQISEVDAGEKTLDKVFLLSISEAYDYWDYLKDFQYTSYAKAMALAQGEAVYNQKEGYWWLLSHGVKGEKYRDRKACGCMEGVQTYGHSVDHVNGGIRPVIRITANSSAAGPAAASIPAVNTTSKPASGTQTPIMDESVYILHRDDGTLIYLKPVSKKQYDFPLQKMSDGQSYYTLRMGNYMADMSNFTVIMDLFQGSLSFLNFGMNINNCSGIMMDFGIEPDDPEEMKDAHWIAVLTPDCETDGIAIRCEIPVIYGDISSNPNSLGITFDDTTVGGVLVAPYDNNGGFNISYGLSGLTLLFRDSQALAECLFNFGL